ncbi:MAG: T9SS type A sorting domain-containing protein, partial [Ignavibacteriae bacterium]|nr:T9SS type A sorting domain-containing protein [Ignavibacteriota bacterium]
GNSVWRRSVAEIIVIQNISSEVPQAFSLGQNYPNPFNPITNIKFNIAKSGNVRITVFDILGKEVAVLVNEKLNPGAYKVDFNGSNFSSGVYFYRLTAGNYAAVKKFILLK